MTRHWKGTGFVVLVVAAAVGGCQGPVAFNYYDQDPSPPPPRYVVVEQGHVCGPGCHHYWDGGRYVVVKRGHVHGPGCGHFLHDGRWIISASIGGGHIDVDARHVCGPGCSHYWDGGRYVVVERHRHGPGCGHVLNGGKWIVVSAGRGPAVRVHEPPARVVRIPAPPGPVNAFVFDRRGSKWIRVKGKHVHGPGCGHVIVEGHWCLHD